LIELRKDRTTHQLEAFESADAHRDVLVQPLLDVPEGCVNHRGTVLERMKERHAPINDVAEATSWWARFGRLASDRRAEELALAAAHEFDEARQWNRTEIPRRSGQRTGPLWQWEEVQEVLRSVITRKHAGGV
jgi:hypothetical protein